MKVALMEARGTCKINYKKFIKKQTGCDSISLKGSTINIIWMKPV